VIGRVAECAETGNRLSSARVYFRPNVVSISSPNLFVPEVSHSIHTVVR